MLSHALTRPEGAADGATVAVLLHGRGSHQGDLQGLAPHLPADWVLVTPQAPHPGHPWGYGTGWAWYRYIAEDLVEEEGFEASLSAVDDFLGGLRALLGLQPGRLLLGGFSQGGTLSLAWALSRQHGIDGVLNFSGFLADASAVRSAGATSRAPPVFWGHGLHDPSIPHALARRGRERLRATKVSLHAHDYEIGHWIDPVEVADAVAFAGGLERR